MRSNDCNDVIRVMMHMSKIGVGDRIGDWAMMISVIVSVMVIESVMIMVLVLVIDSDCVGGVKYIHCVDITWW